MTTVLVTDNTTLLIHAEGTDTTPVPTGVSIDSSNYKNTTAVWCCISSYI